jgi:hypothetical protein
MVKINYSNWRFLFENNFFTKLPLNMENEKVYLSIREKKKSSIQLDLSSITIFQRLS